MTIEDQVDEVEQMANLVSDLIEKQISELSDDLQLLYTAMVRKRIAGFHGSDTSNLEALVSGVKEQILNV
jgi:hypothetical protein